MDSEESVARFFFSSTRTCILFFVGSIILGACSGGEKEVPSDGGRGAGGNEQISGGVGGSVAALGGQMHIDASGGNEHSGGEQGTTTDGGGGTDAGSGGEGLRAGGAPSSGGAGSGGVLAIGGMGADVSGTGGEALDFSFVLGADISSVQEGDSTFEDVDGTPMSIFDVLKNHGFNYIRVKTFVEPNAPYGYASMENSCSGYPEPFGDRDHVIAFGKQIKEAGMGFLLDFHYSDVWADPGNQIIPEAWRGATSIEQLADLVSAYTTDVLTEAVLAGARPDMVQVGNEITPGMLMHVPGPDTDCWGNNPRSAPLGGQASNANWDNLATLLRAGVDAVRAVDPSIQIMLHTENTDDLQGVKWWVDSALSRGVDFDVLGLSCYSAFQGGPAVWENTFTSLVADPAYDGLQFMIAEYNPNRTEANLMIKNLPEGRGLGTFFWEPTRSGEWGESMFLSQGTTMRADAAAFEEYDALLTPLGL